MSPRPFKDLWKIESGAMMCNAARHGCLTHPDTSFTLQIFQIFADLCHRWLLAIVSLQPQVVPRGSKSFHPGLQEGHRWCCLVQDTSTVWTGEQTSKSNYGPMALVQSRKKQTCLYKHVQHVQQNMLTIQCEQCNVLCGRSCRCTISVHHTNMLFVFFSSLELEHKWTGMN